MATMRLCAATSWLVLAYAMDITKVVKRNISAAFSMKPTFAALQKNRDFPTCRRGRPHCRVALSRSACLPPWPNHNRRSLWLAALRIARNPAFLRVSAPDGLPAIFGFTPTGPFRHLRNITNRRFGNNAIASFRLRGCCNAKESETCSGRPEKQALQPRG
jgi:hypothetical protein